MVGTAYLVDSNVLLRWVKPDDRDYPLVVSAIDATYTTNGANCLLRVTSPGFRFTMRDWWPQCEYTASARF
jgi:hypothetical protein